jgi:hypothetical protein
MTINRPTSHEPDRWRPKATALAAANSPAPANAIANLGALGRRRNTPGHRL